MRLRITKGANKKLDITSESDSAVGAAATQPRSANEVIHMVHDLGWVILSLFSVTVLQVLHGVTQYQWHILVT